MVVSPHNPLKTKSSLANDYDRLHLVNLALENNPKIKASSIEFKLPQPSYTIDTLAHLKEKYPEHEFALIMGADNLQSLHKWKHYELLLQNHTIYIYQRSGSLKENLFPEAKIYYFAKHPYWIFPQPISEQKLKRENPSGTWCLTKYLNIWKEAQCISRSV